MMDMAMAQNYQPPKWIIIFLLNMIRNLWFIGTIILSHSHMMNTDTCAKQLKPLMVAMSAASPAGVGNDPNDPPSRLSGIPTI